MRPRPTHRLLAACRRPEVYPPRWVAGGLPLLAACGLALLASTASPAAADEAKEVFDSLFAAKLRQVAQTADRADDVALAADMLTLAKRSANQPSLLTLLCDHAHDLGLRHPDGYATAAEAMSLLAASVDSKRDEARLKLITVLTRQSAAGKPEQRDAAAEALVALLLTIGDEKAAANDYTAAAADYRRAFAFARQKSLPAADDAKAKLEFATARDRTMKQLARLQEALLKDATNHAAAEEIVRIYIVELDDPKAALPYLNRVEDEQMKAMAPLATQSPTSLDEMQALQLAEWYKALASGSDSPESVIPLLRAKRYCERFLELHADNDLQRVKTEAMLAEVNKALEKGDDKPVRAAVKPIPTRPARFNVSGTGYAIAELKENAKAFSNRGYVWKEVPKEFDGWSFTQVAGGGSPSIRLEVSDPGVVFIASDSQFEVDEWKQVPDQSFFYSDRGKSRLYVFARQVSKGEAVQVPQSSSWIGTIVLIPPERR